MKMVEVKTAELIGSALDWAVAHATKAWEWAHEWFPTMTLDPTFLGVSDNAPSGSVRLVPRNPMRQDPQSFTPSTDWAQCGPLIEKYGIKLERAGIAWFAGWQYSNGGFVNKYSMMDGDAEDGSNSPLIAACRAIVAAKLGDVVSVPAELVNGGGV